MAHLIKTLYAPLHPNLPGPLKFRIVWGSQRSCAAQDRETQDKAVRQTGVTYRVQSGPSGSNLVLLPGVRAQTLVKSLIRCFIS
ncbi:hypothetical protein TREES_T100015729 [Tupaia chinensis]|uniref:Uncharacterized protein n=1 Tax=Tupaia chinensis TaxID=246437 RepID=L9LB52_TUPCH|nr:hypothetical protein TREES_T100015729 [Tupaia chinensis]